jgi:hypothetical protein
MAHRSGGTVCPEHYDRALSWLRIDRWLEVMAHEIGDGDLLPLLTSLRMALDEMRESGQLDGHDSLAMMRGTLYPMLKRKHEKIRAGFSQEYAACSDSVRRKEILAELTEHSRIWTAMSEYWQIEA